MTHDPMPLLPEPAAVAYTEWLETLRADLAESINGVTLRGARPVPIGITGGATKRPLTSPGALVGYAIRNLSEEDEATVRVLFHDGSDANGDVVLPLTLLPGESARDWFGPGGINLTYGLFVDIDGSVEGSVYLRGVE
ncbi:hypothetical protein [Nocardioides sp.]|uniref:hypothetical protein n=1 Tax=Nocardioides sp. TaxID=35761 RepID=UPI00321A3720